MPQTSPILGFLCVIRRGNANRGGSRVYSVLSITFGLVLVGMAYGLSFLPSARLDPGDTDDNIVLADRDAQNTGDDDAAAEEGGSG